MMTKRKKRWKRIKFDCIELVALLEYACYTGFCDALSDWIAERTGYYPKIKEVASWSNSSETIYSVAKETSSPFCGFIRLKIRNRSYNKYQLNWFNTNSRPKKTYPKDSEGYSDGDSDFIDMMIYDYFE